MRTANGLILDGVELSLKAQELLALHGKAQQIPEQDETLLTLLRASIRFLKRTDRAEYERIRSEIGEACLEDTENQELCLGVMEVLFGKDDASLLKSVTCLAREFDLRLKNYTKFTIKNVYFRYLKAVKQEPASKRNTGQAARAAQRIRDFIVATSAPDDKFIINEIYAGLNYISLNFLDPLEEDIENLLEESRSELDGLFYHFRKANLQEASTILPKFFAKSATYDELRAEKKSAFSGLGASAKAAAWNGTGAVLFRRLDEEEISPPNLRVSIFNKALALQWKAAAEEEEVNREQERT